MKHNLAIIGFGTIGRGFAEILLEHEKQLKKDYNLEYKVAAVSTRTKGTLYNENGLKLDKILHLAKDGHKLTDYPDAEKKWDNLKIIKNSNANIIIEATPTNINDAEPALTHIKTALSNKKHVITINKGPIALRYRELSNLANKYKVLLRFEGTVMGGTPVINPGIEALAGTKITEMRGILNGTTNFILTEMEKGKNYTCALKEAQKLGYAETNPTADVEGFDALAKLVILVNVLMKTNIKPSDVKRIGITKISLADIKKAKQNNCRWKLIGSAYYKNNKLKAEVSPQMLKSDDWLANINRGMNALSIKTDLLGEVTIIGAGAGPKGTSFAVLNDLIAIHRKINS